MWNNVTLQACNVAVACRFMGMWRMKTKSLMGCSALVVMCVLGVHSCQSMRFNPPEREAKQKSTGSFPEGYPIDGAGSVLFGLLSKSQATDVKSFLAELEKLNDASGFQALKSRLSQVDAGGFPLNGGDLVNEILSADTRGWEENILANSLLRHLFPVYMSRGRGFKGEMPQPPKIQRYLSYDPALSVAIAFDARADARELEVLEFRSGGSGASGEEGAKGFNTVLWEFKTSGPELSLQPSENCTKCHGEKFTTPLLDRYIHWPGMVPSKSVQKGGNLAQADSYQNTALQKQAKSLIDDANPAEFLRPFLHYKDNPNPSLGLLDKRITTLNILTNLRVQQILVDRILAQATSPQFLAKHSLSSEQGLELVGDFLDYVRAGFAAYRLMSYFPFFLKPGEAELYQVTFLKWVRRVPPSLERYCRDVARRDVQAARGFGQRPSFESTKCGNHGFPYLVAEFLTFAEYLGVSEDFLKESSPFVMGDQIAGVKSGKKRLSFKVFSGEDYEQVEMEAQVFDYFDSGGTGDGAIMKGSNFFMDVLEWRLGRVFPNKDIVFQTEFLGREFINSRTKMGKKRAAEAITKWIRDRSDFGNPQHLRDAFYLCAAVFLKQNDPVVRETSKEVTDLCESDPRLARLSKKRNFRKIAQSLGFSIPEELLYVNSPLSL